MKSILAKFLTLLGYTVTKIRDESGDPTIYPYIKEIVFDPIRYDLYITDLCYKNWYDTLNEWGSDAEVVQLIKMVKKGDKILEIGSNNGFTMCLLSKLTGEMGKVIGMEIVPKNCMVLNSQIGLNNITNVEILNKGASNQNKELYISNENNGFILAESRPGALAIEVIPCDDLISSYGQFDLIKIDVEGYEQFVLEGCTKLLANKPKIALELHNHPYFYDRFNSNLDKVLELINLDEYEGVMLVRHEKEVKEFVRDAIPKDEITNIFLTPKV
jgi:FkbM family methyltransferase